MHLVFIAKWVSRKIKRGSKQFKWLMETKDVLQLNPFAGNRVSKQLTPRFYKRKFNIIYVYRYPVPEAHRLIYTLIDDGGHSPVQVMIIDLLNHSEYEKRFGFREAPIHSL